MSNPFEPTLSAENVRVFDRILVEVDETPESLVAAAQATCLVGPGSEIELVGVVERASAAQAGMAAVFAADSAEAEVAAALAHAQSLYGPTSVRLIVGRARDALLGEASRVKATLVAVGSYPHGRVRAGLFGSLDAVVLRGAPCSVLVARPGWGATRPRRIVLGVDGYPASALARRAAQSLADRLGSELEVVIPLGGAGLDESVFDRGNADALIDPRDPPAALAAAASDCDLLVIGDAGKETAKLVERVVYRAHGSVLVVRSSPEQG
jgi:nucleotide-binding universal stress UspA family protein